MEGYAFLVDNPSEEHYIYFTVAMDNGEIWTFDNREIRFCVNKTIDRAEINKELITQFKDVDWSKPKKP